MFDDHINEVKEFSLSVKNFTFSINNVFLQIECHILSDTEIFHCIGHHNPQLVTYPEKMINSRFTVENYCSVVQNIDFLLPEIFGRNTFNLDKRLEIDLQIIFFCELKIWRFRILRLGLRY